MKRQTWWVLGLVVALSAGGAARASGQKSSLADMLDKVDQLDKADFETAIEKADNCTRRRDFACAEKMLADAARNARSAGEKSTLSASRDRFASEKREVAEEKRIAEERRLAEERRREDEREEEERYRRRMARLEAEQRAQDEEDARAANRAAIAGMVSQTNQILADGARRLQQASNDIAAGNARARQIQADQAAERQRVADRQAAQRREDQRDREQRQVAANTRAADDERAEQRRQRELAAERERAEQRRQDQDRERQRLATAEQEKAARARQQEAERARREQEKAERLAAEQKQKSDYLSAMRAGIRMAATKCMDGEGHYYATGVMPKPQPKGDMCIDVHFEASCPDSRPPIRGVAQNFIGMSGCYGDTYKIDPKPSCAVDQVRIRVVDVAPGCGG